MSKKIALWGASSLVIASFTAPALAQSDEIVVTATKREQTLQEVPIAVSVIDPGTIEKAQINDLLDLQTSLPSLRVTQLQAASQTSFAIRGFGNGANNPGIEGAVGVFIDGVFRSRSAAAILDLPTLERIEVLRGPQSTLFGKNVSAGAISIVTKKPEFEWGGSVEATYGNFNRVIFKGSLTGPITDNLAFRISGTTHNRDGYYTNIVDGSDVNDRDRWSARGQLLWEPTDNMSWRAIGEYNKINEVCCGAVPLTASPLTQAIAAPPPFGLGATLAPVGDPFARQVSLDTTPFNRLTGRGGSLQGDIDLGFATLTSITAYRNQTDVSNTDADFSGAAVFTNPLDREYNTFTQEIRLASDNDGPFNWLIGGFYFDETVDFQTSLTYGEDTRPLFNLLANIFNVPGGLAGVEGVSQVTAGLTTGPTALFPSLGPIPPIAPGAAFAEGTPLENTYRLDNESFSFFGQFDFDLTERLTLTGGVAYLNDSKFTTGTAVVNEPLVNFDIVNAGQSILAATALGQAIGTPFDLANPFPFFGAAGALAVSDPGMFALFQQGALAFATNPANAGLNPLLGFSNFQLFAPQVNFPDPNNPLDNGQLDGDKVTYTGRISYDWTDWVNTYFTYSTGWKAGASNLSSDSRPPDPVTGLGRSAGPEDVELFEIGLKANFDGGSINIAIFDQTINGFQDNAFNGLGFDLTNAGEQKVRGFEIESLYSPVEALTLNFALTYLDPEFVSFVGAGCIPQDVLRCGNGEESRDLSGTRPSPIHEISLSASGTYTHDFSNWLSGFTRLEFFYESETPFETTFIGSPTREVKIFNLSAGLETDSGFELTAWARNLTNNAYFIEDFPTPAQGDSLSAYTNEPRTYGVTLRKKF